MLPARYAKRARTTTPAQRHQDRIYQALGPGWDDVHRGGPRSRFGTRLAKSQTRVEKNFAAFHRLPWNPRFGGNQVSKMPSHLRNYFGSSFFRTKMLGQGPFASDMQAATQESRSPVDYRFPEQCDKPCIRDFWNWIVFTKFYTDIDLSFPPR